MSISFASETSSKFPTEQECQQFVRDNRYYGGITIGSFSDETLQQLGEIFSQNRRPLTLKGIYKKWIESHPDSSLTPFKLCQLLTLWEEYPNSYFQFGRIWKKYPVGKNQHTYQTKSTLDYFTKFGGKIVYKKESRLGGGYNSDGSGSESSETSESTPVWIYVDSDNPLSRMSNGMLDSRPFLEEILLNGHVNYPEFVKGQHLIVDE